MSYTLWEIFPIIALFFCGKSVGTLASGLFATQSLDKHTMQQNDRKISIQWSILANPNINATFNRQHSLHCSSTESIFDLARQIESF